MKRYEVIKYESQEIDWALNHLIGAVNQAIEDGWIPKGGVQIVNINGYFIVFQAVSLI